MVAFLKRYSIEQYNQNDDKESNGNSVATVTRCITSHIGFHSRKPYRKQLTGAQVGCAVHLTLQTIVLPLQSDFSYSEHITGISSVNVTWNGRYNITCIEILDQTYQEESGIITLIDGGLNVSYVELNIRAASQNFQINVIINIYGEEWPPNDFIIGRKTEECILLHK